MTLDFQAEKQEMYIHLRYRRSDVLPACRECGKPEVYVHDY